MRTALGARQVPANWNASGNSLEMQVAPKKKIPLQINHQKIERVKCFLSHGKKISILVPLPLQTSPLFQLEDARFSHPKGTALGDSRVKTFEDILSVFTLLEKLPNEAL